MLWRSDDDPWLRRTARFFPTPHVRQNKTKRAIYLVVLHDNEWATAEALSSATSSLIWEQTNRRRVHVTSGEFNDSLHRSCRLFANDRWAQPGKFQPVWVGPKPGRFSQTDDLSIGISCLLGTILLSARNTQKLMRLFKSRYRQVRRIEQAHLHEQ